MIPARIARRTGDAARLFKTFNGFQPSRAFTVNIPGVSGRLVKLGEGDELFYRSNKWEKTKVNYYKHKFKKTWLLLSDVKGTFLILLPIPYKGKKVVTARGIID